MEKDTFRYHAANGEHDILATLWEPRISEPRAVIQIAHGMAEHRKRYEEFANYMTERGYAVCANDHAGHGESVGDPPLYGYFGKAEGIDFVVQDMYTLTEHAKVMYPHLPVVLLGHGVGASLSKLYATLYPKVLAGLLLSGLGGASWLLWLAIRFARRQVEKNGDRTQDNVLFRLMLVDFISGYNNVRTERDWLSRDAQAVDSFLSDPLCNFLYTNQGVLDILRLTQRVNTPGWYTALRKDLPIYLFSGDMDPIGREGRCVKKAARTLERTGMQDVQMKLYPQGRHEMLQEINKETVFSDICHWLNRILKKKFLQG